MPARGRHADFTHQCLVLKKLIRINLLLLVTHHLIRRLVLRANLK